MHVYMYMYMDVTINVSAKTDVRNTTETDKV